MKKLKEQYPLLFRFGPPAFVLAVVLGLFLFIGNDASKQKNAYVPETPTITDELSNIEILDVFDDNEVPFSLLENDKFTGDLDDMVKRRQIRVLVTYNLTNFFIQNGQPHGFEYELIQEYKKYLKTRVKPRSWPVNFVFIPVPFHELIPSLLEGKGDVIAAGMTITDDRAKLIDFSTPYLTDVSEIVVSSTDAIPLSTLDDLAGMTVYVDKSTSYYAHLLKLNDDFKARGLEPVTIVKADKKLVTEDILQLVNAGIVDYTVVDNHIAELWATNLTNIRLYPDITLNQGGKIAWGVRKSNPDLKNSLNGVVQRRKQGTLIGNVLIDKYFNKTKWIENPIRTVDIASFEKLEKLFKKYAKKYDLDWRALAAVAYQESKLNHKTRSPVGAIGIMQVMPASGKAMGFDDLTNLEQNIHAGAKYLAYLRDEHFNDGDITPSARIDFVLAAYNAGPARIKRLRRQAKNAGLDPNVWFSNVEQIARRAIGWETVNYVSNINKYYVAYHLSDQNTRTRQRKIKKIKQQNKKV